MANFDTVESAREFFYKDKFAVTTGVTLDELTEDDFRGGETASLKFILEANYRNPSFTDEMIGRMKKANPLAEYIEGKIWLLYQAVTGYEIFTGETPDLEKMSKVL